MKENLIEQVEQYAIILDDYINKNFKYTLNTEDLEEEIKVISGCLLETIEEIKQNINEAISIIQFLLI
ncbi:MAG: hypothetical protein IKE70_01800 [Bacilli bacterium]|nr:hypothetical protein [Bacilli bacterium]